MLREATRVTKECGAHVLVSDLGLKSMISSLRRISVSKILLLHFKERSWMKAKDSQSEGLQRPEMHSSQEASWPPFPFLGLVWQLFPLAAVLRNRQAASDTPVLGMLPKIKIRWLSAGECIA